jgi:HSP20 family protein
VELTEQGGLDPVIAQTEPSRQIERITRQLLGAAAGHRHPAPIPMEAYRDGEMVFLHFDVPGMDPGSLSLTVQRNVLTVAGERKSTAPDHCSFIAAERFSGPFSRQVFLGDALAADGIDAQYDAGVLTVRVPVAEAAKPRRVQVTGGSTPAAQSSERPE